MLGWSSARIVASRERTLSLIHIQMCIRDSFQVGQYAFSVNKHPSQLAFSALMSATRVAITCNIYCNSTLTKVRQQKYWIFQVNKSYDQFCRVLMQFIKYIINIQRRNSCKLMSHTYYNSCCFSNSNSWKVHALFCCVNL